MNDSVKNLMPLNGELPLADAANGLRERQRQLREDAIIDAAQALVAERGYDAMTMDELALRTGISKPTLYQHFPSKEAIVVRAIVCMMQRCHTYAAQQDKQQPALERLRDLVRWIMHEKYVSKKHTFGAARAALMPVLQSNAEYAAGSQRTVTLIMEIINEAQADGTISPLLSSRVIVQMLLSLLRDAEYEKLIASGECSPEEIGETMIGVLFSGIEKTRSVAQEKGNGAPSHRALTQL